MLRSRTTLTAAPDASPGGRVIAYPDRYAGRGNHRLHCGSCDYAVAVGVDPFLYPAMFEGATHIRCSQCSSINALPIDL